MSILPRYAIKPPFASYIISGVMASDETKCE